MIPPRNWVVTVKVILRVGAPVLVVMPVRIRQGLVAVRPAVMGVVPVIPLEVPEPVRCQVRMRSGMSTTWRDWAILMACLQMIRP